MSTERSWFHRRGDLARGGWESVVDDTLTGWAHTGIRIAELAPGDELALEAGVEERIIVPLAGSFSLRWSEANGPSITTALTGRPSVFSGPTDVLYLSCAARAVLTGTGRVAVASSPTDRLHPTRYVGADEVPVELRGAGASSRQVHNFGVPGALDAERLVVCEVITPAGNWSSYPPHKHDEDVPGAESNLEEIYYFEAAPAAVAPAEADAFGLFSAYSSPAGAIDINARVRTGDIALVPYGYHGPAVAAPGYDLYYLNVMAGPGVERAWRITDDPAHGWVRGLWDAEKVDPRLPFPPATPAYREDAR